MKRKNVISVFVVLVLFGFISVATAQEYVSQDEMLQMKKEMDELRHLVVELQTHIKQQNENIRTLQQQKNENEISENVVASQDVHDGHDAKGMDMLGILSSLKPKINAAGDFVANLSDDHHLRTEEDRFSLRGVDIDFTGEVDGVAKAYFNLAYHDDDVSLEEGYLEVYDLLPFKTDVKMGRFRANFGLLNTIHPHALPQVDYPAVYRTFFGHEGYIDEGVGISGEFPSLWGIPFYYTLQVLNGDRHEHDHDEEQDDPDDHYSPYSRLRDYDDLVWVARLQNEIEPAENFDIKWGLSGLSGKFKDDDLAPRFYYQGADLILTWRPLEDRHKRIRWQSELLSAQVEEGSSWERSYGLYSFMDYQFASKWLVGMRYDYTELPLHSSDHQTEYSSYLTRNFSENNQLRIQFKNTRRNHAKDTNEVFLQWVFTLGEHEHLEDEEH